MPIEEKEDRICLKANKTLVCEVNARTVVISDGEDGKLILERDGLLPVKPGDDVLEVRGQRHVRTGGEECEHAGNVVIQVNGDYTLRVTGNLTIEAGTLNLKTSKTCPFPP